MQSRSVVARLTAGALCMLMSGCALTSPLRGPTPSVVAKGTAPTAPPEPGSLAEARLYAEDMAKVYWKSARAHSNAKTALATALPIVNVGALYHAQTHPDPGNDFLAVAGYGSALGLTLGSLLISPERQRVYLAGQAAALCALHRTDGYVVGSDLDPYVAFDGGKLSKALGEVRAARPDVANLVTTWEQRKRQTLAQAQAMRDLAKSRKLAARESRKSAIAKAEAGAKQLDTLAEYEGYAVLNVGDALARADTAIASATATRQGLGEFASRSRIAGQTLRADIDGIRNAVDVQVLRTEPDVQQIRTSLSATALASLRAPSPGVTNAEGLADVPSSFDLLSVVGSQALDAVSRLKRATAALVIEEEEASRALAMLLAGENKAAQSRACSVANVNGLVVYPPSQVLTAGGEVLGVIVEASKRPEGAIEGLGTGISVVETLSTGDRLYTLRLKADATVSAGERRLVVKADGETQSVPFIVEAAKAKPPAVVNTTTTTTTNTSTSNPGSENPPGAVTNSGGT